MNYREPRPRTCPDCGGVFMARSHMQKRCPACQREAFLAKKRANSLRFYYEHVRTAPAENSATCPHCGRTFTPRSWKQRYCSDRCANRAASERWRRRNGIPARRSVIGDTIADKPPAPKPPAPKPSPRDWMAQVEFDLQIQDPTERYEASRAWSAQQRAYARKLALRAIGWSGAAY